MGSPSQQPLSPTEDRIFAFVCSEPGCRLHEVAAAAAVARGTAQYHLYWLRRSGKISAARVGSSLHYGPSSMREEELRVAALARLGRGAQLLNVVRQRPGLRQREILELLGMNRKVFRQCIARLIPEKLLVEERLGRCRFYYPARSK